MGTPTKKCIKCQVEKPLEHFHSRKDSPDGLRNSCKPCRSAESLEWVRRNRDWFNERCRQARADRPEVYRAIVRRYAAKPETKAIKAAWVDRNKDKRSAISSRYAKKNSHKILANVRKRQAGKLMATPAWSDLGLIEDIYALAAIWTNACCEAYEVDHIVPLQSKIVCGLHVPANLQVLPMRANRRKSNKVDFRGHVIDVSGE